MASFKYLLVLPIFLILHPPCNGDINIVQSTDLDRPLLRVEHGWDDVTPNFWLPDELTLMMVDSNSDSCSADLSHPPKNFDNNARKWILLTSDFNCAVDDIVVNAMRRRYKAVVIYPSGSDDPNYQLKVSPSLKAQLTDINVYFVDKPTGKRLRKFAFPFKPEEKFFVKFGKMQTKPSGGYQKPKNQKEYQKPKTQNEHQKPNFHHFERPNYKKSTSTGKREGIMTDVIIWAPIVLIFCGTAAFLWLSSGRPIGGYQQRPAPPPRSPPPKSPPRYQRRAPSPPRPPPKRSEVAEVEPGFLESFILLDVNFTTDPARVRHAWRIKCKPFHPDQNLGQPQDIIDQRAKMFRRLTRAKEKVLTYLESRGK